MSVFNTPDWEPNAVAEKACTDTFQKTKNVQTKPNKSNKKKGKPEKEHNVKKTITKAKTKGIVAKAVSKKIKKLVQNSPNKNVHNVKKSLENNKANVAKENKKLKKKQKVKDKKLLQKQNKNNKTARKVTENSSKTDDATEVTEENDEADVKPNSKQKQKLKKIKHKIEESLENDPTNNCSKSSKKKSFKNSTLRERMIEKLKAARFRYLNEELYTRESKEAEQVFNSDPDAFKAYHDGYRQQVKRWPLNPLDKIVASIKKMPQELVIADFGCGEAKLAASVPQKVHSFDLVALNARVTVCNMAHCPLQSSSVDVAVFCLSLMGNNLLDFLLEANRVLKVGGTLKIAEVESRFDTVDTFIKGVERFSFTHTWKDLSHQLFYFLDFKKQSNIKHKNKLPSVSLHPCMYKKR